MKTNHRRSRNSQDRGEPVSVAPVNVVKLGLDVHADSIWVVRQLDHATPQPAQKFSPAQFLEWVRQQVRQHNRQSSLMEICSDGCRRPDSGTLAGD